MKIIKMGGKNFLLLGYISENILHFVRNFFDKKEIRLPKHNYNKIKNKHPEVLHYVQSKKNFWILLSSIIFCYEYIDKEWEIVKNFVSFIDNKNEIIIFWLKNTQHHTVCATTFKTTKKWIQKKIQENEKSIIFFNQRHKEL